MSSLVDKICFPDGIHPGPSKSRSPERLWHSCKWPWASAAWPVKRALWASL
jgi:hypothetical protein